MIGDSANKYITYSDSALQLLPINFVHSGILNHSSGVIYQRSGAGYYWESRANYAAARRFAFSSSDSLYGDYRGNGYTLRCLVR